MLVGNNFLPLPGKHYRVSRRTIHKNNNFLSPNKFLIKLKHHDSRNLSNVSNFCRVSLLTMSKYNLKNPAVLLQDNIDDERNSIYFQWSSLALNIIES